jgi:hypothetical protein
MREIVKPSKASTLIDNIEQSLTDIKNNIDKITKNRQQNMLEIRQQRELIQDQIKQMRVTINSHLDTLEHALDGLTISRIDKSPTQSVWFVEVRYNLDSRVCHGVDRNVYISYRDIHSDSRFLK